MKFSILDQIQIQPQSSTYSGNTSNIDASNITSGILNLARLPAFAGDVTSVAGSNSLTLANSGVTAGTYTKLTVNAKGLVISGGNLTASDVPNLSWNKITSDKPTTLSRYGITDALNINGGTMTGHITLSGPPTENLHATTKQYVDSKTSNIDASNITSGTLDPARLPAFIGDVTSTVGSNSLTLANTGVTAGTYTKLTINAKGLVTSGSNLAANDVPNLSWDKITNDKPTTLSGYGITDALNISGGTMTGPITLSGAPTENLHAATKQYVDSVKIVTGGVIIYPNTTTPTGFLRCNGGIVSKTTYSALYNVIGDSFSAQVSIGNGKPWRQQYEINSVQDGNITGWSDANNNLPVILGSSQAIVTKNRVYLIGGWSGSSRISTVYTAPINPDGTLGSWSNANNDLPAILADSQAIVTKNRVYLLGGHSSNFTSTVYTATINNDGILGSWNNANNNLPITLARFQAIVTKNRVYLLGGFNGSYISTVYTAPINTDGTLGPWINANNDLPIPLAHSQAIVTKNRVYLIGGRISNSNYISTVYTAPINDDGTLGIWSNANNNLPVTLSQHQIVITKNKIYLLASHSATVYTAPINVDGTIGTWNNSGNNLPVALGQSQAVVVNNRIYLLGGYNNSGHISTVYTAPFSGGLNDYSPYYDGSMINIDPDYFGLPDYNSQEIYGKYYYIKY